VDNVENSVHNYETKLCGLSSPKTLEIRDFLFLVMVKFETC